MGARKSIQLLQVISVNKRFIKNPATAISGGFLGDDMDEARAVCRTGPSA